MNAFRLAELHQVAYFARKTREALREGNMPKAFRWYRLAAQGLYLIRGLCCRPGGTPTATATLARVLRDLGDDIEAAIRPPTPAIAADLVPIILESLRVMQQRGVDVDDEMLVDRARNAAMAITGAYRVTEFVDTRVTVGKSGALPQ